jgi:hypothetical protein
LNIEIRLLELILSIRDEELPFDPSMKRMPGRLGRGDALLEFGLKIIHHEVDKVRFENLGQSDYRWIQKIELFIVSV